MTHEDLTTIGASGAYAFLRIAPALHNADHRATEVPRVERCLGYADPGLRSVHSPCPQHPDCAAAQSLRSPGRSAKKPKTPAEVIVMRNHHLNERQAAHWSRPLRLYAAGLLSLLLVFATQTAGHAATATPPSATFGSVTVGSSSTISIRLAFTAEAEALETVYVSGAFGGSAFTVGSLDPVTCRFVDGCQIPITFTPPNTGNFQATVEVRSHGLLGGTLLLNIPVSGTGTAPATSTGSVYAIGKTSTIQGLVIGVKSDGITVTGVIAWTRNGQFNKVAADCLKISGNTAIVAGTIPDPLAAVYHSVVFAVTDYGFGNDLVSLEMITGRPGACPQFTAADRFLGDAVVKPA